ncbi:glycosyltransferase family 2 protein [Rhodococcoides fascians]|uniref:glycosyltransferase family 2 protein n=1 Tax=Rhodococcoides fascians TaxID=1828 RepID=UPI00050CB759|nr:glycosyltransferase family 2 protein [Rhodococcus fascians]
MTNAGKTVAVIVNYKSAAYVQSCIRSMLDEDIAKIVVVDNWSGEQELKRLSLVASEFGALVRVVANTHNDGFGAGVNLGAMIALESPDCEYLWIINPDTTVEKGALKHLLNAVGEGADIVAPVIVTGQADQLRIWFAGGDLDKKAMTTPHHEFGKTIDENTFDAALRECTFLTGASMLTSRRIWLSLGGFRDDLFMYWEDADLCARAAEERLKLAVATKARIWHAVGATSGSSGLSPLYYYYMQRNRVILAREWGTAGHLWRGRGLRQTLKLLIDPYREQENKIAAGRKSAAGLLDGLLPRLRKTK